MKPLSTRLMDRMRPFWPVRVCGLGMMFLSAIGFMIMEHNWTGMGGFRWYLESIVVSFLLAQIALVTILGGLITRHWLTGWLMAVVLACIQTVMATVIAEFPQLTSPSAVQHIALCSIWPVLLLSTCAPLVALRTLFGWTLRQQSETAIPRWKLSMEDLILVGVVIACSMTTSQMFLFSEGPQNLPQLMMIMGIFAATSLICIPPVVYVSFRARNWTSRLIGWVLLAGVAFVVILVESVIMDGGNFRAGLRVMPEMIVGIVTSSITMAVGVMSLMASGYRLTHFERSSKSSPLPVEPATNTAEPAESSAVLTPKESKAPFEAEWLDDAQPERQARPFELTPQWQARLITLGLVGVAALGALGIHLAKLRTLRFYEGLDQPGLLHVYASNQKVTGLEFGPDFVDSDLQKYLKYRDSLLTLSFARTKITDAILPELKAFPNLQELDLSGTAITDAGLEQLALPKFKVANPDGTPGFQRLSLADTKVKWAAIQQLAKKHVISHLDLSGLQISDADLATGISVSSLRLSHNPITDEGLPALLKNSRLHGLDVSDTAITGSTLNVPSLQRLNLDGTAITDATLTAILNNSSVSHFSLRRTGITPAVLPLLVNKSIRLGKGAITENDLAALGPAHFDHLGLNDKQFTGKCMTAGTLSTLSLDLSNSSVTDDVLMSIGGKGNWFQFLGLANTKATDGCLLYLQAVSELDIRGTRVTGEGLRLRYTQGFLVISHDQFTPKQLSSLHGPKVEINKRPRFSHWPE